ncbi:MAG: hypothetical protein AAF742_01465 [Pseudomonadota bacterium]
MARSRNSEQNTPRWYLPLLIALLLAAFANLLFYFSVTESGVHAWEDVRAQVKRAAQEWHIWGAAFAALFIGSCVGAIELIGRYRDAPVEAIRSSGARWYILVNGVLAAIAFAALLLYSGPIQETGRALAKELIELVVISGFGSLAVMRASFARTQIGETRVEVGPAIVIETLLDAADRSVDRIRALDRIQSVEAAIEPLRATITLPVLVSVCLTAMQNISDTESDKIEERANDRIGKLLTANLKQPQIRFFIAGLILQQEIGTDTFAMACQTAANLWDDRAPVEVDAEKRKGIADQVGLGKQMAEASKPEEKPSEQAEEAAEADPKPESTEEQDDTATNTVAAAEDAAEKPNEEAATPAQEKKLS